MDTVPTLELLTIINDEDDSVASAVRTALPQLANAVDEAAARFEEGGTIHYLGAGTSGRIAAQDAAELIPTFGLEPGRIVAHIAGGQEALWKPVEGAEDNTESALVEVALTDGDVVLGLTASGTTPYVAGGLRRARDAGCLTILLTSNEESGLIEEVDIAVVIPTGPEVLMGSTRLKAGSAQKMALNSFSTVLMTRVGRTWSNLMVSMAPSNHKLRQRAISVVASITGSSDSAAEEVLAECDYHIGVAILRLSGGIEHQEALDLLEESNGSTRRALDILRDR